jgi:hypothetical protein
VTLSTLLSLLILWAAIAALSILELLITARRVKR